MLYYNPFFDEDGNPVAVQEDVNFPDNPPSLLELYRETYGKDPSGKYWDTYVWLRSNIHNASPAILAPPGTPEELLGVLRTSLDEVMLDPEFRANWRVQFDATMNWNPTDVSIAALKNYKNVKPEYMEVLDELKALDQ